MSEGLGIWAILGAPEPNWQWQGKGYLFYSQADQASP